MLRNFHLFVILTTTPYDTPKPSTRNSKHQIPHMYPQPLTPAKPKSSSNQSITCRFNRFGTKSSRSLDDGSLGGPRTCSRNRLTCWAPCSSLYDLPYLYVLRSGNTRIQGLALETRKKLQDNGVWGFNTSATKLYWNSADFLP